MLVVRRRGAISHTPVHKVSEVEDRTSSLKEESRQNRDSVAETTRKEMASRAVSKQRAVGPMLVYLRDTEVGSRESAVENAIEWRRGGRRTTRKPLAPIRGLDTGRQLCLKAEDGAKSRIGEIKRKGTNKG